MIAKAIYAVIGAAVLFFTGVYVGEARCEKAQAERNVERLVADGKLVDTLKTDDNKKEVIYRDRIKIVREVVDNCLTQPIAGPVLEQLHHATRPAS